MIVRLKPRVRKYRDLAPGGRYVVIGIEADDLRILNDSGRPFLYPASDFIIVDSAEPEDWVGERGEDGERYAYPPALNAPGFFERFFDNEPEAVATFWQTVNRRLAAAG